MFIDTNHKCCTPEKTWADKNRCLSVKQLLEIQHKLNSQLEYGVSWSSMLSVAHFETAIVGELGEVIDQPSSPAYKWWKKKDPETYSEWMTKLEIIDITHFFLSIAIIEILDSNNRNICKDGDSDFIEYDYYYVGSDRGNHFSGIGLVSNANLSHLNFMRLVKGLLCTEWDFYGWVDVLDHLVSSVGLSCEEMSALYMSKATLNSIRWDHPDWEKIDVEGVEDNERLFPLVQAFLDDTTLTFDDLKESVIDEFYTKE